MPGDVGRLADQVQQAGPKPGLTLDRIVATAITVADADGLVAVSMRRVAIELGVGTMSLYRYVPGKGELLDLMLDKVSDPGEVAERMAGLDWRGVLETYARGTWDRYLSRPWLLQVNWARPALGPSSLAGLEVLLRGLIGIALSDQERMIVIVVVESFVTWRANTSTRELPRNSQTSATRSSGRRSRQCSNGRWQAVATQRSPSCPRTRSVPATSRRSSSACAACSTASSQIS